MYEYTATGRRNEGRTWIRGTNSRTMKMESLRMTCCFAAGDVWKHKTLLRRYGVEVRIHRVKDRNFIIIL